MSQRAELRIALICYGGVSLAIYAWHYQGIAQIGPRVACPRTDFGWRRSECPQSVYRRRGPTTIGYRSRILRRAPADGQPKLEGVKLRHFWAFLDAASRENDYLWGRLDAAELILRTLDDTVPEDGRPAIGHLRDALSAVLANETDLSRIQELTTYLGQQIYSRLNTTAALEVDDAR
ncbi:DUF3376 domain-containing protein [Nocardia sp. R16R-3T]